MKINKQWGDMGQFFFCLNFESFYLAFCIFGIDIEFHIHNLRGVSE